MKFPKYFTTFFSVIVLLLPLQSSFSEESVYGWNMMTEQERIQHRETMHNFKTNEERERYRIEHHKRMQERAKERGLSMPAMPRDRMGTGMGSGMGSGSGSGQGGGKGR